MKSITHTKSFEIAAPIGTLFPLFSPEGEKLWVPGWDYENILGTTELAEDYVFLTKKHDHGTKEAIWVVKNYSAESHFVQYYKIEPGDKFGVITVDCQELEENSTKVEVTYKYIALSQTGERFVAGFDKDTYDKFIGEWGKLLRVFTKRKQNVQNVNLPNFYSRITDDP